jgi:phenylacetate-CoA ligase
VSSAVRSSAGSAPARRRERDGLWTSVLRGVVLPAGDAVFGQRMMRRLRHLEAAQWWEPERVEAERDRLLADLVAVAHREVPFYREHLDSAGVDPRSIRTARDLARVPVVTKAMLRSRYPDGTTRATGQRTFEACSSGSTGVNFCVREDMETAGWYRASFLLSLEWSGWRIGEPHLQTGITPERRSERAWKDRILRCHYESAYDMTDEHLDRCLDTIERGRLRYVFGYPASLYYLARRAAARGWNRPLSSAVTWGDMLHPHWRREIEAAFRTRVFDTYGCGEGFQIAAQCGEGSTYHVHSLDVIVHYVDERGREVSEGEPGNVVVTRLHPGPMPLVRYLLGDSGVRMPARKCPCGRGFELMTGIEGRSGDVVVTPSGNRLIVHFFTGVLEHFRSIATFQVVQEEPDLLRVRVVPGAGFDDSVPDAVRQRLRDRGVGDMRIEVEVTSSIERPKSNKHRFVLSRLAAEPAPAAAPARADS